MIQHVDTIYSHAYTRQITNKVLDKLLTKTETMVGSLVYSPLADIYAQLSQIMEELFKT